MCKEQHNPPPATSEISRGAALAHGCCGGFQRPAKAGQAVTVIPFAKRNGDGPGDCVEDNKATAAQPARQAIDLAALTRIRQFRGISQVELAGRLNVSQPHIAQIEQQSDMLLSTLNRHVQALGGELHLVARFPDGSFNLKDTQETA